MISLARYPTSRSSLMFLSVTEEAIHLPCEPDPDMAVVFGGDKKDRNLGVEARAEEEEGVR